MPKLVQVLLVSAASSTREGLRSLLDTTASIQVVGDAQDWTTALEQVQTHRPHVVILDSQLPDLAGTDLAAIVQSVSPMTRLLAFGPPDSATIEIVLTAGVAGYVLHSEPAASHKKAIRAVASGQDFYSPPVVPFVVAWARRRLEASQAPKIVLTSREQDVLAELAKDKSDQQIAQALGIGVRTVQGYVAALRLKFEAPSRTGVVAKALRMGLIPLDDGTT